MGSCPMVTSSATIRTEIQRARERDVQPHLALGVRDPAEVCHDHRRPLESLEAQECVADDRVGDSRVVRRHDVVRPQARPPEHRALRLPPAERDHRDVARREARDAQPVDLARDTIGDAPADGQVTIRIVSSVMA